MLLATILLAVGLVIVLAAIMARIIFARLRPNAAVRQQMIRNQTLFAQMRIAQATRQAVQQMDELAREHLRQQQGYRD